MFGRGFIFAVFQIYYPESTLIYAKMTAPARIFISKRDTIRWKISLDVSGLCTKVEYRELVGVDERRIISDSIICVLKGERRFKIYAEVMDYNSGKVLRNVKGGNLRNPKDMLISSLIYNYVENGVNLKLRVFSKKERDVKVRFGIKNQWERWKYFDEIRTHIKGETVVEYLIPKKYLSFGKVRFLANIDGVKRETEILFNEFNIENDRDFNVLLSVLDFVYGKKTDMLRGKKGKERLNAWEEFWETVGGQKAREEFLDRLYVGMQLYPSNMRNKISDRALVYTKFGPPDEIISEPFRLEGKPYEVWYYYRLGLKFIFVDFDGTGDYRLVPEGYLDILR